MYLPWEAKYISVCLQSASNSQKIISPSVGGERLEFLHGTELQIQKDSRWLSSLTHFWNFQNYNCPAFKHWKSTRVDDISRRARPLPPGNERSLRQLFVSRLSFCTPILLPGSWGAGMKSGRQSIGGRQECDKTVGLCPSPSSYTSRAHPARPRNESALDPHGPWFYKQSRVCGNQLASWLTLHSFLGDWIRCSAASVGEFWNTSVYS